MPTYVIGDIQGCYDPFRRLLDKLAFDPSRDRLWVTGDVVNRGPASLAVLRTLYELRHCLSAVLGNHDITLLAVAEGVQSFHSEKHTFQDLLSAEDSPSLIEWLSTWPLAHHDPKSQALLVHAGVLPSWDLPLILSLSAEFQRIFQSPQRKSCLFELYGDEPNRWSPTLQGPARWRFIINTFTRLRFCSPDGQLELLSKEGLNQAPAGFFPWFQLYTLPQPGIQRILFGHWAALQGNSGLKNLIALDTGCVWGNCLTAYLLEEGKRVKVRCERTS